jgi:hypothetical protein
MYGVSGMLFAIGALSGIPAALIGGVVVVVLIGGTWLKLA